MNKHWCTAVSVLVWCVHASRSRTGSTRVSRVVRAVSVVTHLYSASVTVTPVNVAVNPASQDDDVMSVSVDTGTTDLSAASVRTHRYCTV